TISSRWSEKATVLAGDFLLAKAAGISARVKNLDIVSIFADAALVICEGEIRQDFDGHPRVPARPEYLDHIYSKTASLFAACAESAAVLNEAPEPERVALREYGRHLGMAFQIIDDVLDFVSTQREIGKPVGSDLRQGIVTLPAIYFYEQDARREALTTLLSRSAHPNGDLDQVIDWIRTSPAIPSALADARRFGGQAQAALETLPDRKSVV